MAKLTSPFGLGPKSAHADMLLAVEAYAEEEEENPHDVCFVHLCLATGRHAQFPSQQTFVQLDVISEHGVPFVYIDPIRLRYAHGLFVKPLRRMKPPVNQQKFGPLKMMTEVDLAVHIVLKMIPDDVLFGGAQRSLVKRVLFRHLTFVDLSLNMLQVTGERSRPVSCSACAPTRVKHIANPNDLLQIFDGPAKTPTPTPTPKQGDGEDLPPPQPPQNGVSAELEELGLDYDEDLRQMYAALLGTEAAEIDVLTKLLSCQDVDNDVEDTVTESEDLRFAFDSLSQTLIPMKP